MIKIHLEANDGKTYEHFEEEEPIKLVDVALLIRKLEEMKLKLLEYEFEDEFSVEEVTE